MSAQSDDSRDRDQNRPNWAKGLDEATYDLAVRGVFTTAAAAAYTDLSEGTIRQAIATGQLKARKQGKGWRIQKRDLDAFFNAEEA